MSSTQTAAPFSAPPSQGTAAPEREIVFTRIIDAPRDLVFKVWIDPKHIAQWWGPKGFTNTIHEMDVTPGGVWRFIMHGPDGVDYPNKVVFDEVVAPEYLSYTHTPDGDDGPGQFYATVTFAEQGKQTNLTLRLVTESVEHRQQMVEFGAVEGGNQTLERLAEYAAKMAGEKGNTLSATRPTDKEIVLTRVLDAPRRLVFEAWTRPEHVVRWWGCGGMQMPVCDIDLRVGGAYRYVVRMPDGQEFGFNGVYNEILAPERLVYTYIFEPMPQYPALSTVIFEERDGKTRVTETILHQTTEARDGHFNSGMEAGAAESFNRLEEHLKTMS